jgi:hemolysin activation/secretion protein
VRDGVPEAVLRELKAGMPVDQASLDRVLLLVSDLPSTQVKGTLRPGKDPGTSELIVDVEPAPPVNGSVSADDFGNSATGRERLNAGANFDNPLRAGDVLAVSAQTAGRGMNYGRLGYTIPLAGPATLADLHASTLGYHLVNGAEAALDAHGSATVIGAALERVLLRSTSANWTAQLGYDKTQLDDHVAVTGINTDRHTDDWRLALSGSIADGTGITTLNAAYTWGQVVYDNATALIIDQSGAQTEGRFDKVVLNVGRLQTLSTTTALYGSFSYQGAGRNLDSAEQIFLGGPASVRAYDNGTLSGAQGNSQTLELRQQIAATSTGRWQGTLMVDHAQVQMEKKPFTAGANGGNLSGAGLGLNWAGPQAWAVNTVVSTPVGGTPELAGHRDSVRAWAQISKGF